MSQSPEPSAAGDAADTLPRAPSRLLADVASAAPSIVTSSPFFDHAMYGILFGNAVTMAGALFAHWPALPVMWVYWGQSVAIGAVNVVRILWLKDFSTAGVKFNGESMKADAEAKVGIAGFFAVHYGIFHFVYAIFLASGAFGHGMTGWMPATVALNVLIFAGVQLYPVLKTRDRDYRQKKPNLGTLMFYPYMRIVPMHLTIIFAAAFPQGALPLFILLKTGADIGLHRFEQKMFLSSD